MRRFLVLFLAFLIPGCASPPVKKAQPPLPQATATPLPTAAEPQVDAIPNPVRGKKVAFRVMASGVVRARIKVYNHFLVEIRSLEQEGSDLFDVIWVFKNLEEGIYYYQANLEDLSRDRVYKLKAKKFVVLRDEGVH